MAIEARRPGVFVSVEGTGIPPITEVSPAQYFSVGLFEWGPVNRPTLVGGLSNFRRLFGNNVDYSHAPRHFQVAYGESNDTLSGWIVRVFETRKAFFSRVAAVGDVGDTHVFVNDVTHYKVGDKIGISSAGNENLTISAIDTVARSLTLSTPLTNAIAQNQEVYYEGTSLDDYKATCPVEDENGQLAFTLRALYPSALGNSFKTEIAPGPISRSSDRIVRVRGRQKNYTFEWKGSGTPPTAVADPGANASPAEQAAYSNYLYDLRAYNQTSLIAEAHNRQVVKEVYADAAAGNIDFTIEMPESGQAAALSYVAILATTQTRISNKVNANALDWSGGSNGESVDNADPYIDIDEWKTVTPYEVFIGDFDPRAEYSGLQALNDERYGTGVVVVPGYDTPEMWDALIEHAESYNRLGLGNFPKGTNPQDAGLQKLEYGGSKCLALYYGYSKVDDYWIPNTALAAGLGSRNTANNGREGGIKASWTGRVRVQAVEDFFGRDAVDDVTANLFSRADINLNYVKMTPGIGYRLDSQFLSLYEGATTRVFHTIVNNCMVYSIKPALVSMRDKTIDRTGELIEEFILTAQNFFRDYGPGKPEPRGNTLWNPAIVFDVSSINDLNNQTLRMHAVYSQSPKAERIILGLEHTTIRANDGDLRRRVA